MADHTEIGETVFLPDYVVEVAELLAETEGHTDPLVRAVRKMLVQSAVALRQAHDATQTSDPAVRPEPASPATAAPGAGSEPRSHLSVRQRLLLLGVDQPTVREWAADNGVDYNRQGTIRTEVLDAYEAAHGGAAA